MATKGEKLIMVNPILELVKDDPQKMQRRSLRPRTSMDYAPKLVKNTSSPPPSPSSSVKPSPGPPVLKPMDELSTEKPKNQRPRRSKRLSQDTKIEPPNIIQPETKDGTVVLNARGMPARQRKRNRYYDEEEDRTPPKLKVMEKKLKVEPVEVLIEAPGNSLKVTPIVSEQDTTGKVKSESSQNRATSSKTIEAVDMKNEKPKVTHVKISNIPRSRSKSEKVEIIKQDGTVIRTETHRRSDVSSFIRFFAGVKGKVIMPDRWGINGVMFDPVRKMKTFSINEMEVDCEGKLSIRKSLQVFEDFSVRVMIQGVDLTKQINDLKKIKSENDVPDVLSKIVAIRPCTGLKNFGNAESVYFPTAKKKGLNYFAYDCSTILPVNYAGTLCPSCNKVRNFARRRKAKVKQDKEKACASITDIINHVPNGFGKNMFGFLNQLTMDDKYKKLVKPVNSQLLKGGLIDNDRSKARRQSASGRNIRKGRTDNRRRQPELENVQAGTPLTISHVIDPNTGLAQAVLQPAAAAGLDYLTLATQGNIVFQNGGQLTFDDGQEYELIGEADPGESYQVVEATDDQAIQIIEVDDQTMAQFASQNISFGVNNIFLQDGGLQITEVDPNDPNSVFKIERAVNF